MLLGEQAGRPPPSAVRGCSSLHRARTRTLPRPAPLLAWEDDGACSDARVRPVLLVAISHSSSLSLAAAAGGHPAAGLSAAALADAAAPAAAPPVSAAPRPPHAAAGPARTAPPAPRARWVVVMPHRSGSSARSRPSPRAHRLRRKVQMLLHAPWGRPGSRRRQCHFDLWSFSPVLVFSVWNHR